MKPTHKILLGLVAASAWLVAGSVTIPKTFTANTTAKAAEVNANFSAVKTAVNGNAGDIATNKSGIATNKTKISQNETDIAANQTDIGLAVTDVTVGNGLEATRTGSTIAIKKRSGYVAVHGSAFSSSLEYGNHCVWLRNWSGTVYGAFFGAASTDHSCKAFAEVVIPNGAAIKKLTCRVKHNVAGDLHVRLYMQNREYTLAPPPPTVGDIQKALYIDASLAAADQDPHTQEVSGTYTPPGMWILNPTYKSYYIEWDPHDSSSDSSDEALYDCKVDYEY